MKNTWGSDLVRCFRREVGVKTGLCLFVLLESIAFLVIDAFTHQYRGGGSLLLASLPYLPELFLMFVGACLIRTSLPRVSIVLQVLWVQVAIISVLLLYCSSAQYTSFGRIDGWLNHLDGYFHFHTQAIMNYTYGHAELKKFLLMAYKDVLLIMLVSPLLLAALCERRNLDILFVTAIVAMIIGDNIYYFFPSIGPVSVIKDHHFLKLQHDLVARFFQLHHHKAVTASGAGGLIAFPSFHVIWAVTLLYVFRNRKLLFYPLLIVNSIAIAATLFLGWHYLVDVLAGFIVAALSLTIACYLTSEQEGPAPVTWALLVASVKKQWQRGSKWVVGSLSSQEG